MPTEKDEKTIDLDDTDHGKEFDYKPLAAKPSEVEPITIHFGEGIQLAPLKAPEPNIKFIGKKRVNGELVCGDPPASVRDAYHIFEMPDPDQQKAGFFHPKAKRIIRAFPNLYQDPNNAQSGCCSDAK